MRCTFCGLPAVAFVVLQEGCFARPDDREQWLCDYHFEQKSPLGGWWLLYSVG